MENTQEEQKTRRKRRNKYRLRLDLLEAVSRVLREKGYINLNINNVCEYADVDRNAVYRHFKDFDSMLSQFIETKDYWVGALDNVKDVEIKDFKLFLKQILFNQYDSINKDPELQQLLIWELAELSLRTKTIAQRRETLSENLIKQFDAHFKESGIDFNTICAIIIAGIYYLIMHKKHSTFCLVDFVKEKERMLEAIDQIVEILFEVKEKREQTLKFAANALRKGFDEQTVCEIFELSPEVVRSIEV